MNNKNLIPFSERSEKENWVIRSKGGKTAGKNRRRIKKIAEIIRKVRQELGNLDPVEAGVAQAMIDLTSPATKPQDRVKIAEFIRDTIGEKPLNKSEISGKNGEDIKVIIKDFAQK